jgi:hypothetical protein
VGAPKGLTQKQARFCAEYAIDSNATRAAMAAGYSKSSARVIGSQLLQIPAVKAEVRRLELEILGRLELTADSVKEQIRRIGFFDIATIYEQRMVGVRVQTEEYSVWTDSKPVEIGKFLTPKDRWTDGPFLAMPKCEWDARRERLAELGWDAVWMRAERVMKHPADWPKEARAALAGYDTVVRNLTSGDGFVDTVLKVKMNDRVAALDMLAKHFGLTTEKVEVNQEITMRWLPPEPSPEVETIDAPAGPVKALGPFVPGELLVAQEEMGSGAAPAPPVHRTLPRIFSGAQGDPSSAVFSDGQGAPSSAILDVSGMTPAEVEERSGLSMRQQRKMFPELREG